MSLEISGEIEQLLQQMIATGAYQDPEAAIRRALTLLQEEQSLAGRDAGNGQPAVDVIDEPHEQWAGRLAAFAARQRPTGHAVDDSRTSIYSDRS